MKRIATLCLFACMFITANAQKKYEMVVEKTDGTEIVVNVEDIVRTYFRERSNDNDNKDLLSGPFPVGKWQECDPEGNFYDDATDNEVMHLDLYNDNTGDWYSISQGQKDPRSYSFTYTYTLSGTSGSVTMTILPMGITRTLPFTYENGILHAEEIYYRKLEP